MLLVFVLAAAVCMQAFLWADGRSAYNVLADRALIEAQSTAEVVKHFAGDLQTAASSYGGNWDGSCWIRTLQEFSVTVTYLPPHTPYLASAQVCVAQTDGTVLSQLTVCWQEVTADE